MNPRFDLPTTIGYDLLSHLEREIKMATKQVRWKCLNCNSGVLAPSRPRRDDVRRYCLPCSSKAGRLVERTAPALEKKREATKSKATEKQKAKRAKAADAKTAQCGFDVDKEAIRLWKILMKQHPNRKRRLPSIKIVKRNRETTSGHYESGHLVQLNLGTDTVDAWECLAHELVHALGYHAHDHIFYRHLKQLTEARWKIAVNSYEWNRAGYNNDWNLREQLDEMKVVNF
jgi:hypothetical protein